MTLPSNGLARDAGSEHHPPRIGTPSCRASVEFLKLASEDRAALQRLPGDRAPVESVAQCLLHTANRRQAYGREFPRRMPKRKSWNFPSRAALQRLPVRQRGRSQCRPQELQLEHNRQRAMRRWSQRQRSVTLTRRMQTDLGKQRWYPHRSHMVPRAALQRLPEVLGQEESKQAPRLMPGLRSGRPTTFVVP